MKTWNQYDWFLEVLWRERFEALSRNDMDRWTELVALIERVESLEVHKSCAGVEKLVE